MDNEEFQANYLKNFQIQDEQKILPNENEYFYIGIGCDEDHIDNIYRCINKEDENFLKKKLKTDIEDIEKWVKNHPKAEKKQIAQAKVQIEWLKKLKLWHIAKIIVLGDYITEGEKTNDETANS